MRIGTRLLVTYLLLVGLVAGLTFLFVPRWVSWVVTNQERSRLQSQARAVAQQLALRLRPLRAEELGRLGRLAEARALQNTLRLVDGLLTDVVVAVVNADGEVLDANRPELRRERLPLDLLSPSGRLSRPRREAPLSLQGMGPVLAVAEPIQVEGRIQTNLSVVLIRQMTEVEGLTKGLTRWLRGITLAILALAMLVAGWVSRGMVRRLKETGAAARALAEGDLARRAPEQGADEITELAGHFNHMAERIHALVDGLRRSEASRKRLLATASHEIRTPLTSIRGFAEALRDGMVPEEAQQHRYHQIIAAEAERLNRLVDDLFDVARLEAGQAELRLQEMEAGPWLTGFAQAYLPPVGLSLELDLTPEAAAAVFYGDQDRLAQVLTNLVENAFRFTPEGRPVRLEAETVGGNLVVRVVDRGPGLSPEEVEQIFRPFHQAAAQGRSHKGAGLGLAIAKALVEAHGGALGVESQPGQGAAFWFRLRLLAQP